MKRYFYLDRIQDFGVLWPVMKMISGESYKQVLVLISARVWKQDPPIRTVLSKQGIPFCRVSPIFRTWSVPLCTDVPSIFITASESNAKPHRVTLKLVQMAKRKGLQTITYQHGFENIGLTYSDDDYPCGSVCFASDQIVVWSDPKFIHPDVSADTRVKLRFQPRPFTQWINGGSVQEDVATIAVFENLHWNRYTDEYRRYFIESLNQVAEKYPDIRFVLKPHVDHVWTDRYRLGKGFPANLSRFNPDRHLTAVENTHRLLQMSSMIITTPSTIALDAAMLGKPVMVARYGLDLRCYEPLHFIDKSEQWEAAVLSLWNPDEMGILKSVSEKFVRHALVKDGCEDPNLC